MFFAVLIATVILSDNQQECQAVADPIWQQKRPKMIGAELRAGHYIDDIQMCLRLISLDPRVMHMARDRHGYLQEIYEANCARHRLTRVCVIEGDSNENRRPLMTFGQGGDGRKLTERHPREREAQEYAKQIKQIHRCVEGPLHESLPSEPVCWYIDQAGVVCSVPIR